MTEEDQLIDSSGIKNHVQTNSIEVGPTFDRSTSNSNAKKDDRKCIP